MMVPAFPGLGLEQVHRDFTQQAIVRLKAATFLGTALYSKDVKEQIKLAISSGMTHLDGAQVHAFRPLQQVPN